MGFVPVISGGATNRKNYQKNPQKLPHILDMMGHVWAKFHASTLIREFTANFISGAWNRSAETEMMGRVYKPPKLPEKSAKMSTNGEHV